MSSWQHLLHPIAVLRFQLVLSIRPFEIRPFEIRPFEIHPFEIRPFEIHPLAFDIQTVIESHLIDIVLVGTELH